MRIETIERDVLMFVGESYESVATVFLNGRDALLVDSLAGREDALSMLAHLEMERNVAVKTIIATHYMPDHMAGLTLCPDAEVIAHRFHRFTYLSRFARTTDDDRAFRKPTTVFDSALTLHWGRHRLDLFHNPGKTMCAIGIDVPTADLIIAGDAIVGNIVYVARAAPDMLDEAASRFESFNRSRVIGGHIGMFAGTVFANARHYLRRLRSCVAAIRQTMPTDQAVNDAIRAISIESCLAPGVIPVDFERVWHGWNIVAVLDQRIFQLDAVETHAAGVARRSGLEVG